MLNSSIPIVHAQFVDSHSQKNRDMVGGAGHLAAHKNFNAVFFRNISDVFDHSQNCRIQGLVKVGDLFVSPVDGQRVLNQVIGTDAEKVDLPGH
jgi:hypothetical protein